MMSQGDLEEILQALDTDGNSSQTSPGVQRVRTYDFRRPGKFAKDQLRTLTMLHEIFARLMTSFFAAHLRARVQMGVRSVEQQTYQEFLQGLQNPTVLGTFRLPPLPGICLIHMSNHLALSIVDRVFGGTGAADQPERALTEIEQSVMRRAFQHAMGSLQEAWHRVIELKPQLENIEVNPLFVQVTVPGEVLAVITLTVDMGAQHGELSLGLPFSTVEPILARLSPQTWLATVRDHLPGQAEELRRNLSHAPVQVVAQLGQARLTVSEFLQLSAGSVVLLNQRFDDDVAIYVDNQLAFLGRPGVAGNRMVVAIRERVR